jgi:tetratricopeptide (TPR) repeat protein
LRAEAVDDPLLQLELAAGYRQVGDIQGAANMSNLGRRKQAMQSYQRALALVRPVALAGGPQQRAAQHELVLLHTRIGGVLDDRGDFAEAEAVEQEGVRIGRELAAAVPGNAAYQRALGNQYIYLAQMYFHAENAQAFLATTQLAEEQLKKVLTLMPHDPDVVANLAAVYGYRGLHYMSEDLGPESSALALAEVEKALAVMAPAYERHPDHLVLAPNYAKMLADAGTALQRMGRNAEALEHQRRALQIEQALLARSPTDVRAIVGVAQAQADLGETLIETGGAEEAVAATTEAARLYASLPSTELQSMRTQYYHGWALFLAGNALQARAQRSRDPARQAADMQAACARWRESLPIMQANHERKAIAPDRDGPHTVRKALERCH